VSSKDLLYP